MNDELLVPSLLVGGVAWLTATTFAGSHVRGETTGGHDRLRDIARDRDATIAELKRALKQRSGKSWSVTGGHGTAWGWITISAPPARRGQYGYMSDADRAELRELLGLERVHQQGESVPASTADRLEYLQRANGMTDVVHPDPYWD